MLNGEWVAKLRTWIEKVHPGAPDVDADGGTDWPLGPAEVKYLLGCIDAEAARADAVAKDRDGMLAGITALLNAEGDAAQGAAQYALARDYGLTSLAGRLCLLVGAAQERDALRAEVEELGRQHDTAVEGWQRAEDRLNRETARLRRACAEGLPRERILCPNCGKPHVDGADGTGYGTYPHHTHECHHCKHVWDNVRWSFGADVPAPADATPDPRDAEIARLKRLMETAVPWRVSPIPTEDEMRALRQRWAFGPERYQADADVLISAVIQLKADLARAQRVFDEGLPRERILCPACGKPHVEGPRHDDPKIDGRTRPHHEHRCYHCGNVWDEKRWTFGADVPANPRDGQLAAAARELIAALDAFVLGGDASDRCDRAKRHLTALLAHTPDAPAPPDAQWYAYDPATGYETFGSPRLAREAAEYALEQAREQAPEGWPEGTEQIQWGRLIPCGVIRQSNYVPREEDTTGRCAANDLDSLCDYDLATVARADAGDDIDALRAKNEALAAEADALRAPSAASEALDDIVALCNAPAWEYPGQVVRDVQAVVERLARLDALVGMAEPWPLRDVLAKLVEAATILLDGKDYDGDGWEQIDTARRAATEALARLNADARETVADAVARGRGRGGLVPAFRAAARELLDAKAALPRGAATTEAREAAAARMTLAELTLAALVELPEKGTPPTDAAEILRLRAAARAVSLALGPISHLWAGRAVEALERALDPAWYAAQEAARPARVPCTGLFARWCPNCGRCTCPGDPERGDALDHPACSLHAAASPHGDDGSDAAVPPGVWGAQAFQRAAVAECRAMEAFLRGKGDAEKANGVRIIGDLLDAFAPTGVPGVVTHV